MPTSYLGMSGSKEGVGVLFGGGAVFWAWGEEMRVQQVGGQEAEWGQVADVWSHQSGEQRAEWGQALGEGAQPPYVTGHEWLH